MGSTLWRTTLSFQTSSSLHQGHRSQMWKLYNGPAPRITLFKVLLEGSILTHSTNTANDLQIALKPITSQICLSFFLHTSFSQFIFWSYILILFLDISWVIFTKTSSHLVKYIYIFMSHQLVLVLSKGLTIIPTVMEWGY